MTASPAPGLAAVLFDWDDTLVDNWPTITLALNAAYAAFGMPTVSIDEAKRRATRSLRDSFPEIFGAEWERARTIFLDSFAAHHIDGLAVKPGAPELLAMLGQAGVPMAIVSNKNGPYLRAEVAHLRWGGAFRALVGAGDAAADKPDRAVVDLALAGSGLQAGRAVWLVGDTPVDMACALAADCTGVRLRWNPADDPPTPGEIHAVSSLHELRALVSTSLSAI
ncbi:MAG: HAD family hydrolase [Alphaproteobacteria bacterium]